MPMDTEIARSFLDWSTEEVTKWLGTLSLSQDYSEQFKGTINISMNSKTISTSAKPATELQLLYFPHYGSNEAQP